MEALGSSSRPSGISSIINREKIEPINTDHTYPSSSNMAATALVSPTSMYSNNGPPLPPYSSGWAPQTNPISGLISPPESRRTSDNKETPPPIQTAPPPQHRQSLPSIHEALNSAPKPNPYASPVSASLPPSQHQLPYSQGHNVPRSYPPESAPFAAQIAPAHPRHPSPPQPIHANPFSRPEQVPASFAEARHSSLPSLQTASGPPPNPYSGRPYEPSRYEQDPRAAERLTNGYTHHPGPQQQGAYTYGPVSHMPPSGSHPTFTDPRYTPGDAREPMDAWKGREEEKIGVHPFRQGLKRHLADWDFENNLAQINISSNTIQEWSRNYNLIAQEQQQRVPDRMPTLDSCEEMLMHNQKISYALQRMKETIHQQEFAMQDQRMRDYPKGPGDYDDDISMYGEDMKSQGYGSESKKRRGRAAPPGRCHSCNRAETPEWRRGPDGARTLCNACGLHYAKLTRKNTMKQSQGSNGSSLRPKSMDDHSPRQ